MRVLKYKFILFYLFLICFTLFCISGSLVFAQEEEEDDFIDETDISEVKAETVTTGIFEDIKNFDISGFRIGMPPKVVMKIAKEMRYIVNKISHDTPEYVRYNFDIICRKQKIFQIDALNACIDGYAKKKKLN